VSGDKWAKVPHALILDGRVSAGAIRLYARLCNYQFAYQRWHKALPKDLRLANDLDTSTRNIRRWRKELVATGWAEFEYHGTVLAGLTLNDRTELSADESVRVLRPDDGPNPDPAAKSVLSDDEESEVPPVETGRNARIYSVPAPKDEGQGLIPSDSSTSEAVASADAEGTSIDMVPELVSRASIRALPMTGRARASAPPVKQQPRDPSRTARRARLERALHQQKLERGYRSDKLDEMPSFEQLYPRKAAA
jgi:hypothetical protein